MQSASLVLACWSWAFCVAFLGCVDPELPEVNFIGSEPAAGSRVPTGLNRVRLFFDATPRSVTVNGMTTRVENTKAFWEIQDWLDEGDITLAVEWLNQDGSDGKGAVIHYKSIHILIPHPLVVETTIIGDNGLDPNQANRSGITFRFDQDVRPGIIEIWPEGGKPLNWIAAWRSDFVTITPQSDEDKLLHGKDYVLKMAGVRSDATGLRDEALESLNFTTEFTTKE